MTLLEEIQAKCLPELIASRDYVAIANAVSEGRTCATSTAIGKGTILSVLGLTDGSAFLDVIDNVPEYRHVKSIITAGQFDVSLSISIEGIQAMVPTVITQAQADTLIGLAKVPDPVSNADVEVVMKNPDGSNK